jgi:aminoglycoside phosphotransferase (APT) family kinase protein
MNHGCEQRQPSPKTDSEQAKERLLGEAVTRIFDRLGTTVESRTFLAHGNHNDNYLVMTAAGKRVLRLEKGTMFHNLGREYETLTTIPMGLGPRVFAYDGSHELLDRDYLVEEFLEGEHPEAATEALVGDLARWFKELHAVKRPMTEAFRVSEELAPYVQNFEKYRAQLPPEVAVEVAAMLERARELAKGYDTLFADDREESLCHGDASAGNIMVNDQGIKLIDWEFANYGLPETELVYFMRSFNLDEPQKEFLLDRYDYPKPPEYRRRLAAVELLNTCSDIGYSLWRLDLMAKGEVGAEEAATTRERLTSDIALLKAMLANPHTTS